MRDVLDQLYQTKLQLLAVLSTVGGVALLLLARWAEATAEVSWLATLPLTDIGSALFTTGLLAVAFEYIDRRDGDERANQRLRQVLREEAPTVRDAVVDGFTFNADSLKNVASPELLNRIARNALALRLGDQALAEDTKHPICVIRSSVPRSAGATSRPRSCSHPGPTAPRPALARCSWPPSAGSTASVQPPRQSASPASPT